MTLPITQNATASRSPRAVRLRIATTLLRALAAESDGPVILLGNDRTVLQGAPSDIDLAVGVRDRRSRARLIRAALQRLPWPARLVQVIQHEAEAHYFVVAVEAGGRWELFQPDLSTDYVRLGRRFVDFAALHADARPLRDDAGESLGVGVPSVATAADYYLVKRVSKGTITPAGIDYLGSLMRLDPEAVRATAEGLFGTGARELTTAIESGSVERFAAASTQLRASLHARIRQGPRAWFAEAGRVLRRLQEPTGATVSVYGVDGSGKGTVLAALAASAGPAFREVDAWHLLSRSGRSSARPPVTAPHASPARSLPTSLAKLAWYLTLAWTARAGRIAVARRRSRLVLIDRDMADLWLDPVRYRFGLPRWVLRGTERLMPKPDLTLVLDADVATIEARSDELKQDALVHAVDRYRGFAAQRACAHRLDASLPAHHVAFEAADALFAWMETRTLRRVGVARGKTVEGVTRP